METLSGKLFLVIIVFLFQEIRETTQLYPLPPPGSLYYGALGWYGAAKYCPFIIAPYPGILGRACIDGSLPPPPFPGPVPPPQSPPVPPTTTTTASPPQTDSPEEPSYDNNYDYGYVEEEEPEIVYKRPKKRKRKCRRNRY